MANPAYEPNNPAYYTPPQFYYFHMSKILGDNPDLVQDPADREISHASLDNLKAFMISRMPQKPDRLEDLQELLNLVPELRVDPSQHETRRQMSADAREAIANVAASRYFATKLCDPEFDRTLWVLLSSDPTETGMEKNRELCEQLTNGTPEERGKVLEERVNASMELFNKLVYGELTDREIIDNFGKFHELQDLMTNARNFLPRRDAAENMRIAMSDDIVAKLQLMERHSTKADIPLQRIKMMASADYEFLALENLRYVDQKTFDRFNSYVTAENSDGEPIRSMELWDTSNPVDTLRGWDRSVRKVMLMEEVEKDFLADAQNATLKFVGVQNNIVNAEFTYSPHVSTVEDNLFKGYVLATTPSGKAGVYHVEVDGTVAKASAAVAAKDMMDEALNDLVPDMKSVLGDVAEANKGFFIGSRAYSQAFKGLKQLAKSVDALGNPPAADKLAQLQEQLQNSMRACKAYMDKKNPSGAPSTEFEFKNAREKMRYEAMEKAYNFCLRKSSLLELHSEVLAAEAMVDQMEDPLVNQQENANEQDSFEMAFAAYKSNVPAVSNVGNRAQEFHKIVTEGIEEMLKPGEFEPDVAKYLMAGMVTLEMVNKSRSVDAEGNIIASDLEQVFQKGFAEMVSSVRDNPVFQAMTENVTLDMLRNFVINNDAKTICETMAKNAENRDNIIMDDPSKQLEQELDAPKVIGG